MRTISFTKKPDHRYLLKENPGRVGLFLSDDYLNPWLPQLGEQFKVTASVTSRLFATCCHLMLGTQGMLEAAAIRAFNNKNFSSGKVIPMWQEVHDSIKAIAAQERVSAGYSLGLRNKVHSYISTMGKMVHCRNGFDFLKAFSSFKHLVFEQNPNWPVAYRRFNTLYYLDLVFRYRQQFSFSEIQNMDHICIFLDDASEIFWKSLEEADDPPAIFQFISESQEYGISVICATQFPEFLGASIINNSSTVLALRLPSEISRKKIAEIM